VESTEGLGLEPSEIKNDYRFLITDSRQVLPLTYATYEPQDLSLEEGASAAEMDEAALEQAIAALSTVPGSEKAIELLKEQAVSAKHKYGVSEYGQPFEFYDPMLQVLLFFSQLSYRNLLCNLTIYLRRWPKL